MHKQEPKKEVGSKKLNVGRNVVISWEDLRRKSRLQDPNYQTLYEVPSMIHGRMMEESHTPRRTVKPHEKVKEVYPLKTEVRGSDNLDFELEKIKRDVYRKKSNVISFPENSEEEDHTNKLRERLRFGVVYKGKLDSDIKDGVALKRYEWIKAFCALDLPQADD